MISYREQVLKSWVQDAPSVRGLASLLGVPPLVSVRGTLDRLRVVETVSVDSAINTDDDAPINGHVTITLRSDGTYVFSGFMRATGLPSYNFAVQAWVDDAEGTVLAA